MPHKYHIETRTLAPRFHPVGKFATVEFREDCAGSCKACVKKKCVYDIYKDYYTHISAMPEPEFLYTCESCFRCVQECTKGIFSRVVNPEYKLLGDAYWTPEIIQNTWYQAHTGRVPVSGAGYRGKFSGTGFDAMWTDMSEIVRPTRDGIHGREYISTSVELTRRPMELAFNPDGSLTQTLPEILEIRLPLILQPPAFGLLGRNELIAMAKAAQKLDTLMLLDAAEYSDDLACFAGNLAPRFTRTNYENNINLICQSRLVELAFEPGIEKEFNHLRRINPVLSIAVGLPLDARSADRALALTQAGVDVIHLYADDHGHEIDATEPRLLRDLIREVHTTLVAAKIRPKVNLIFSGGIALAEHMAKAVICGVDAVAVDIPLLIALECRVCGRCQRGESCLVAIGDIEIDWGVQRILNLIGAWHSQLIEVMGACGIREARRMRGEIGRAMFMADLERDSFAPIFGTRKVGCG
jgi:ferredoxin